jgi:DNA-binding transcriptional ArsR family regulator
MNVELMQKSASSAAEFLRSLANEKRLKIVCQLAGGEKSVGEICDALEARQSTISQQLALLRRDGIVKARKEAQTVFYSLADENTRRVIDLLYSLYCAPQAMRRARKTNRRCVA